MAESRQMAEPGFEPGPSAVQTSTVSTL